MAQGLAAQERIEAGAVETERKTEKMRGDAFDQGLVERGQSRDQLAGRVRVGAGVVRDGRARIDQVVELGEEGQSRDFTTIFEAQDAVGVQLRGDDAVSQLVGQTLEVNHQPHIFLDNFADAEQSHAGVETAPDIAGRGMEHM